MFNFESKPKRDNSSMLRRGMKVATVGLGLLAGERMIDSAQAQEKHKEYIVTGTAYPPLEKHTDSSPYITAAGLYSPNYPYKIVAISKRTIRSFGKDSVIFLYRWFKNGKETFARYGRGANQVAVPVVIFPDCPENSELKNKIIQINKKLKNKIPEFIGRELFLADRMADIPENDNGVDFLLPTLEDAERFGRINGLKMEVLNKRYLLPRTLVKK